MPFVTKANEVLFPMTQSVTQSSTPDYIAQAQVGVKKFYPQYENYFNSIFEKLKMLEQKDQNFINKTIHKDLDLYSIDIKTEKDKWAVILMAFEKMVWKKDFQEAKDVVVIDKNEWYDLREAIACEIEDDIKKIIIEKAKKLEYMDAIMDELGKRMDTLNEGTSRKDKRVNTKAS